MIHPSAQYSDSYYLDGLRESNRDVVAQIYREFRGPIIRSIQAAGGSAADGAVFLQLAVLDAAALAREGHWPAEVPFYFQLRALSLAHFSDWMAERGQPERDGAPVEGEAAFEHGTAEPKIPAPEDLHRTRNKIFAWKTLDRLDAGCRDVLLQEQPEGAGEQESDQEPCLNQWRELLFVASAPTDGPGQPALLPEWAEAARRDVAGYQLWRELDSEERRVSSGETAAATSRGSRRTPIILGTIFIALIAWALYQRFGGNSSPEAVYRENFSLPSSILDDIAARNAADTSDAVVERPLECEVLFEEADRYFQAGNYTDAVGPLTELVNDSHPECHSDAYYYLGLISLQLQKPELTLQCFAKIEDLERFGEDIYWYQSLAMVKIAEHDPGMRERAERAVERAVANSRNAARQRQAEEMLKKLKE